MIMLIFKVLVGLCMCFESWQLSRCEVSKDICGVVSNGFMLIILTMFFLKI